jgi:N-formylmaleamate deformylase
MEGDGRLTVATEVVEQQIQANDIRLHVATAGDEESPPLLLIHGLYDRWERWEPVIASLSERFRLIIPDLRGHGQSEKPSDGYLPSDYAQDLAGVIRALNLTNVIVVGHSLGGVIGTYLANQTSQNIQALVMVDPPLEWNDDMREMTQMLLDAKRGSEAETLDFFRELYWHTDESEPARLSDWLRSTADGPFEAIIDRIKHRKGEEIYDELSKVSVPVLLMQADPMAGSALSEPAAAYAKTLLRSMTHVIVNDAGHSIHHERPDRFTEHLVSFITNETSAT